MSRPLSPPPVLAGYSVVRHLGGGGFADVYLYEQEALKRQVAVKVLRANASSAQVREEFRVEAMLMAALSEHPNIVTVHDAAIAEDGRPFLVMTYYPDTLSTLYKAGPMGTAEVLAIGIELAGAVETIHRQNILHRDIKPANMLTTQRGRPALTDFGISVSSLDGTAEAEFAMSIPWSPPEIIAHDGTADHRSDIYSLTASIYTLLAGRSPYESRSLSNSDIDLIDRIQRAKLPPLGRSDVPASLERVLARGLARQLDQRFPSALELARALQQVQTEMGGKVTAIDVLDEDPVGAHTVLGDDGGRTRIRRLVTIEAQSPHPVGRTIARRPGENADAVDVTTARAPGAAPAYLLADQLRPAHPVDTQVRPGETVPDTTPPVSPRPKWPLLAGAGVAAALAVSVTVIILMNGATATDPVASTSESSTAGGAPAIDLDAVPPPGELAAERSGTDVLFRWSNPKPEPLDRFYWRRTDRGAAADRHQADGTSVALTGVTQACIEVVLVRDDGSMSEPASTCSDADPGGSK
ncbi:serine/threonine protein kinase [Nakamurella silvestris]|nr:serine/threonine protein kinase [Nakamurella silvestris]